MLFYFCFVYLSFQLNGHHRRKWTRRHEFKSVTRLNAFHFVPMPLEKAWGYLFYLQQWVSIRANLDHSPCNGKQSRRRDSCISLSTHIIGKGMNLSVPSKQWVKNATEWAIQRRWGNQFRKRKTEFEPAEKEMGKFIIKVMADGKLPLTSDLSDLNILFVIPRTFRVFFLT